MSWKIFLAAFGAVILATLGGLFVFLYDSDQIILEERPAPPIEKPIQKAPQETLTDEEKAREAAIAVRQADRKVLRDSLQNRNLDQCDLISNKKMIQECQDGIFLARALESNEVTRCDAISDEKQRVYCQDQVFYFLARDEKKFEGCANIKNESTKVQCDRLADRNRIYSAKDITECTKIEDSDFRRVCTKRFSLREISAEDRKCNFDDVQKQRDCEIERAAQIAHKQGTVQSCNDLVSDEDRQKCLLRIQEILALEERDKAIRRGDSDSCATISNSSERRFCMDRAYFVQAGNEYDVKICEKIESQKLRTSCADKVSASASVYFSEKAKRERNPNLCQRISETTARVSCQNLFK